MVSTRRLSPREFWTPSGHRIACGRRALMHLALACGTLGLCNLLAAPVAAYTPESPEVKAMVERGYAFLATSKEPEGELGGDCLLGITLIKHGARESNPIVARVTQRALQAARTGNILDAQSGAMYSAGLCCLFLLELDAVKYRAEIISTLENMTKRQKQHGGFSYPTYGTGDTSQTQYVVLSYWTAHHAQVPIPIDAVERVCNWLLRTQDVAGGWGYQGVDGAAGQRSGQSDVSQSLSSAGLGSVYVCADLLGFGSPAESVQSGYPPAVKLIPKPGKEKQKVAKSKAVSEDQMKRAMTDGNRWFSQNLRVGQVGNWHFYFMYALERYMSFRELAESRDEAEPAWYNAGVEVLASLQQPDGSFGKAHNSGPYVDSCFAILFLTRSTKAKIAEAVKGEGTLTGGKGLKGNMASARVKDGKIIAEPTKGTIDDLVSVLEDPRNPDVDALAEFPESWINEIKPEKLLPHVDRLRRLVFAEKFEVRMVAVRALGRMSDFDNVPHLIFALTDPDPKVVKAANDALRATTRKFSGYQLPPMWNEQDRFVLVKNWKDWYRSVHPTAVFLD